MARTAHRRRPHRLRRPAEFLGPTSLPAIPPPRAPPSCRPPLRPRPAPPRLHLPRSHDGRDYPASSHHHLDHHPPARLSRPRFRASHHHRRRIHAERTRTWSPSTPSHPAWSPYTNSTKADNRSVGSQGATADFSLDASLSRPPRRLRRRRAFTLVEVLVASLVLTLTSGGIRAMLIHSRRLARGSIVQNSVATIMPGWIKKMKRMEYGLLAVSLPTAPAENPTIPSGPAAPSPSSSCSSPPPCSPSSPPTRSAFSSKS